MTIIVYIVFDQRSMLSYVVNKGILYYLGYIPLVVCSWLSELIKETLPKIEDVQGIFLAG